MNILILSHGCLLYRSYNRQIVCKLGTVYNCILYTYILAREWSTSPYYMKVQHKIRYILYRMYAYTHILLYFNQFSIFFFSFSSGSQYERPPARSAGGREAPTYIGGAKRLLYMEGRVAPLMGAKRPCIVHDAKHRGFSIIYSISKTNMDFDCSSCHRFEFMVLYQRFALMTHSQLSSLINRCQRFALTSTNAPRWLSTLRVDT